MLKYRNKSPQDKMISFALMKMKVTSTSGILTLKFLSLQLEIPAFYVILET